MLEYEIARKREAYYLPPRALMNIAIDLYCD